MGTLADLLTPTQPGGTRPGTLVDLLAAPTQQPEPGLMPALGHAMVSGIQANVEAAKQTGQLATTGAPAPAAQPALEYQSLESPLTLADVLHPKKLLYQTVRGLFESSPEIAGSIAGGAVGAGLGGGPEDVVAVGAGAGAGAAAVNGVKMFAPIYAEELQAHPEDKGLAFDNAWKRAAVEAASTGLGFGLFGVGAKAGPFKHLLMQAFGVQPAIAVGGRAAENIATGEPSTKGLESAGLSAITGTLAPVAAHATLRGLLHYAPPVDKNAPASDAELNSLFAEQAVAKETPPPQDVVDLRQLIPGQRDLTLGPEAELPRESIAQTGGVFIPGAEKRAGERTLDFFNQPRPTGVGAAPKEVVPGQEQPPAMAVKPGENRGNLSPDQLASLVQQSVPSPQTLHERLTSLPPASQIVQGAPGIVGDKPAISLAQRASVLWHQANDSLVAGKVDEARVRQQSAAKLMERATEAGFDYTSPERRMAAEGTKAAANEVGAVSSKLPEVKPTMMAAPGMEQSKAPGQEIFRQQPELFQNEPAALRQNLTAEPVRSVGKNLYAVGSRMKNVEGFIRPLLNRILPDHKIIIDTRPNSPFQIPGAGASYTGFKNGVGVIHFPEATLHDEGLTVAAATHELGHAIVHAKWADAPSDVQQAIYAAWGRHLQATFGDGGTAEQFMGDLHSPFALATLKRFYDAQLNQNAVDFVRDSHYSSWYSFDEWIAEQASKWMFTNRRTLTLMDRFFKSIGQAMEKTLRFLGRNLSSFTPNKAVKSWLDSMLERRMGGALPLTAAGTLKGYSEGVIENARALGVKPSASVAPPQAEWAGLRTSALKLGVSKKTLAQADRWSWWIKGTWNLIQLANENRHIAGLQAYTEAARNWYITKMTLVSQADGRVKEWRALGKDQSQRLSNFVYDIDSMKYLKPGENARWPTTQELVQMAKSAGMTRPGLDLYMKVRDDFLHVLDRIEGAWKQDAARTYTDPARLASAVAEISADMAQMRSRPYFPHERYGDWTVAVRDAKGQVVHYEQTTSERAAVNRARELERQMPGHEATSGKLPEEVRAFQGLPPRLIRQMAGKIPGLTKDQLNAVEDMAFSMSPANAFARHLSRRKGTPGYSLDAIRGYANYFLHAGGHIARLEHSADMQDAIASVNASAKAMRGVEAANVAGDRQGIADWMQRHHDYVMNPGHEWAGLRSAAFTYYLGFNVASALMNLTQIPMVAWPYLGARFGDLSTLNALRRSAMDLHKTFSLKPGTLPKDEIDAIGQGISQGFLDESLSSELSATAQGGVLQRILPGTMAQRAVMNLGWAGGWMFQKAEQVNRRVTFSAAYRLAKAQPNAPHIQELIASNQGLYKQLLGQGMTPTNAGAFLAGRDAVERSQFEYAAWARPEFVRGKKGVLFTFWQYRQNMLWFLKNDPGRLRAAAAMFAAAGLMGLPGAQDLNDLLRYIAAKFGKDFNAEQEARRWIAQFTDNPDLVMHGPGHESFGLAWAGQQMGIPIPSFDMASRLGMGQLVPGMQAATELGATFDEKVGKTAQQVVGAAWGIPLNMVKAMESNDPDTWKRWERMMPPAFRQLDKAVRMFQRGAETTQGGAAVAKFDVTDPLAIGELVGQALGFTPSRLAEKWDENAALQDAVKYWSTRRGILFNQFAFAAQAKDREALADSREAIREYNSSVPDKRLRIGMDDLRSSLKQRALANKRSETGRAGTTYSGIAARTRSGYPSLQPSSNLPTQ